LASANQLGHDSVSSREGHDPDFDAARQVHYILSNESLHLGLPTERLLTALLKAVDDGSDPMSLPIPEGDRRILATILMHETEELTPEAIESAVVSLRERRLRSRRDQLLSELVAAERKGDSATLSRLTMEKMQLDRQLIDLQNAGD
jgi:DNA primase